MNQFMFTCNLCVSTEESLLEEQARRSKKQKDRESENNFVQQAFLQL